MAAGPNQRNWKGISIALGVIILILGSVAVSVVILTPPPEEPRVKGTRFGIQHILDHRFNPPPFNGSWISGKKSCILIFLSWQTLDKIVFDCIFSWH